MKRYSVMLLPLTMMALVILGTGCNRRTVLKTYGDWRYAQGVEAGRADLKPLKEAYDKCVDELTQLKTLYYGSIQQQRNARTDK